MHPFIELLLIIVISVLVSAIFTYPIFKTFSGALRTEKAKRKRAVASKKDQSIQPR